MTSRFVIALKTATQELGIVEIPSPNTSFEEYKKEREEKFPEYVMVDGFYPTAEAAEEDWHHYAREMEEKGMEVSKWSPPLRESHPSFAEQLVHLIEEVEDEETIQVKVSGRGHPLVLEVTGERLRFCHQLSRQLLSQFETMKVTPGEAELVFMLAHRCGHCGEGKEEKEAYH